VAQCLGPDIRERLGDVVLEHALFSRRTFLAAAGLGTAAVVAGCSSTLTNPPKTSPFLVGPYQAGGLVLGEYPATVGMPQTLTRSDIPPRDIPVEDGVMDFNLVCQNNAVVPAPLPTNVKAAVYYPYDANASNPIHISTKGPFPILLLAHGFRDTFGACLTSLPIDRDFTRYDFMLRHVVSYGCVAIVPDVSWLPGGFMVSNPGYPDSIDYRAEILLQYYRYLQVINSSLFANQLDLSRVVLVGHSTGGPAATEAGPLIQFVSGHQPLAYGLIAPIPIPSNANPNVANLLVLQGALDTLQGADPVGAFTGGALPKTLVTIPGANHWGYTDLCGPDNSCKEFGDTSGTISAAGQQNTGASYLAALVRLYALGDATARPYLTGQERVEGLEIYGVAGIQVQQAGYNVGLPVTPGPAHP
jgi:hypothetical protein